MSDAAEKLRERILSLPWHERRNLLVYLLESFSSDWDAITDPVTRSEFQLLWAEYQEDMMPADDAFVAPARG